MPTPPTVALTYTTVGGPVLFTTYGSRFTWGGLRFPFGLASETEQTITDLDLSGHWYDYSIGFLAADTSLFRFDASFYGVIPPATITYVSYPGPPPGGRFLFTNGTVYPIGIGPFMENDTEAQITGQTVTMTSGSFNITSDSYTRPPTEQSEAPYLGDYISIGKLLKV